MKRIFTLSALILPALMSTACSNRATYENMQRDREQQCLKLPQSQYEQCMREAKGMSYDEYERERKALLEEDK